MSGTSIRYFLVAGDSELYRIPSKMYQRVYNGAVEEKLRPFAGKRVRVAEIVVRLENRKPIQVLRANYYYIHFKNNGILDKKRLMEDQRILLVAGGFGKKKINRSDTTIDASQEFAKKRRDHCGWWKPELHLEGIILDASIDNLKCKRI